MQLWLLSTGLNQLSNITSRIDDQKEVAKYHTCLQAYTLEGLPCVPLQYCSNRYGSASLSTKYGGFHNFPVLTF